MIIVGIDPSINGTGLCRMTLNNSNLEIQGIDYMSFTTVKKHSNKDILHIRKKDYENSLEQNDFTLNEIFDFCIGASYVGIEDYAYAAKGLVFNIAEFVGCLKYGLWTGGKGIRMIEPTVVKKYATGKGNADKIRMEDEYMKTDILDLASLNLPEYKSPKLDIIDAYYVADLLRLEVQLRHGIVLPSQLPLEHIEIFNRVTKANPVNILARPFLEK